MRKVILYISMSLDGYIATPNNEVDSIIGNNPNDYTSDYEEFIENIDTMIIGRNTYNQVVNELSPNNWPYSNLTTYLITSKEAELKENVYIRRDLVDLVNDIKNKPGKDIWVNGGASIINQLLRVNLIDELIIAVIPVILGSGIPLFEDNLKQTKLLHLNTTTFNGITSLRYKI